MRAGFWEILLIVILVLILFGHAKIPDLMKNLANGINVFKKELKGSDQETKSEKKPVEKKKTVSKKKTVKKTAKK
ncbi:MAG TPA: twin-arginine translocase TatA/TatE family subunit [Alphaproteobacteria bacterium]|nr:twin-arginine translocase TatA/TatE family subunit [Alphaproteobacteria bacterium]